MNSLEQNTIAKTLGLKQRDIEYLLSAMKQFPQIDKAVIFGSRAKGNFKKASDIDIAIFGKNITRETVLRLSDLLNEQLPIPFFIDIVHYDTLQNNSLKNEITQSGVIIYEKNENSF